MSEIWTKICGTTRAQDAMAAAQLGADAIGVVLYAPSPRAIAVTAIAEIFAGIDDSLRKVALFVDPEPQLVEASLQDGIINLLQFHGNESQQFCSSFGTPYMKAVRVQSVEQAREEIAAHEAAKMILLDKYQRDVPGGTGKTFDWEMAAAIVQSTNQPVVLAGGLNADNVRDAIAEVNPFGVDVSSGVEASHGVKDMDRLARFIHAAKREVQ
ncbi:MAG: phosphoribosylanthranilate isomerase [Proteobacteria bacterium]|nr:phosphoribosylanthranilate isomerase [Pseudomonadota bacterium]MDA0927478.1 phosphoribosylanthranilate isomerase [Pseudomonadota bacterium]